MNAVFFNVTVVCARRGWGGVRVGVSRDTAHRTLYPTCPGKVPPLGEPRGGQPAPWGVSCAACTVCVPQGAPKSAHSLVLRSQRVWPRCRHRGELLRTP